VFARIFSQENNRVRPSCHPRDVHAETPPSAVLASLPITLISERIPHAGKRNALSAAVVLVIQQDVGVLRVASLHDTRDLQLGDLIVLPARRTLALMLCQPSTTRFAITEREPGV